MKLTASQQAALALIRKHGHLTYAPRGFGYIDREHPGVPAVTARKLIALNLATVSVRAARNGSTPTRWLILSRDLRYRERLAADSGRRR